MSLGGAFHEATRSDALSLVLNRNRPMVTRTAVVIRRPDEAKIFPDFDSIITLDTAELTFDPAQGLGTTGGSMSAHTGGGDSESVAGEADLDGAIA